MKLQLSNGNVINQMVLSLDGYIRAVTLLNNSIYLNRDEVRNIYKFPIEVQPQFTPLYLGKAVIGNTGTMDFSNSLPTTNKVPTDPHHLVPKAYVDKYNADIVAYLTKVLDGNGLNDLLTRISDLEEQVNRSYKALWNVDRTEPVIRTSQNPGLVFNPEAHRRDTTGNNADMIANPPSAPSSLGSEFTA
jgi:hypothetical protein